MSIGGISGAARGWPRHSDGALIHEDRWPVAEEAPVMGGGGHPKVAGGGLDPADDRHGRLWGLNSQLVALLGQDLLLLSPECHELLLLLLTRQPWNQIH